LSLIFRIFCATKSSPQVCSPVQAPAAPVRFAGRYAPARSEALGSTWEVYVGTGGGFLVPAPLFEKGICQAQSQQAQALFSQPDSFSQCDDAGDMPRKALQQAIAINGLHHHIERANPRRSKTPHGRHYEQRNNWISYWLGGPDTSRRILRRHSHCREVIMMDAIYDGLFRLVALLVYSASIVTITMSIYLWGA